MLESWVHTIITLQTTILNGTGTGKLPVLNNLAMRVIQKVLDSNYA